MLSNRYSRQINLIGEESQKKLAHSSVVVVGAGGIGSPCLYYLAAGGIGNIGFVDHDRVNLSNLHRQVLYDENSIGKPKTAVATEKLSCLNSEINYQDYHLEINLDNAKDILSNYDLVIDATDNFKTRYLINDICCKLNKPFINASIFQNKIQIMLFEIQHGCYRCAFPEPPPPFLMNNCSDAGVLGASVGIAGTITANIAINYLIDQRTPLLQKIYALDCNSLNIQHLPFNKRKNCPACTYKLVSWPSKGFDLGLEDINLANFATIDIREHNEDRSSSLTPTDIHIPFSQLIDDYQNLPNKKLLFYCKTGLRSEFAAHLLQKNGCEAFSLRNGIGFRNTDI